MINIEDNERLFFRDCFSLDVRSSNTKNLNKMLRSSLKEFAMVAEKCKDHVLNFPCTCDIASLIRTEPWL